VVVSYIQHTESVGAYTLVIWLIYCIQRQPRRRH